MKSTPPITVLLPVYNAEVFLREAIESILNQTFKEFEFLIIDDGSTDNSLEIINEYSDKDKRIKVVSRGNKGLVETLNEGIDLARGKYIARMDADDISKSKRLEKQYKFLETNKEYVVTGASFISISQNSTNMGQHHCFINDITIKHALPLEGCIPHPTATYLRSAVLEVGGYRSEYFPAEDYDLWRRLSIKGKMHNISLPMLYYRHSASTISSRKGKLATKMAERIKDELWEAYDLVDFKIPLKELTALSGEYKPALYNLRRRMIRAALKRRMYGLGAWLTVDYIKCRIYDEK